MTYQQKISALIKTKHDILKNTDVLKQHIKQAEYNNAFFTKEFCEIAIKNIFNYYLDETLLNDFCKNYIFKSDTVPKTVGIVMAGNIPLVGFHDFLCCYLSPHNCIIKFSQKDEVLLKYFIEVLTANDNNLSSRLSYSILLKGCDAYIATGSSNSAKYFEYYFAKYPHIIRDNKTSVAVITGEETLEILENLADDVFLFFGLGCRNVTKIYIPTNYNFELLITAFKKYDYLCDHNKLKNNFDYNLALAILNNTYYMATKSILLLQNNSIFSPISVLHYEFYENKESILNELKSNEKLQCIVSNQTMDFGKAQQPNIFDFADGIDTMNWLQSL